MLRKKEVVGWMSPITKTGHVERSYQRFGKFDSEKSHSIVIHSFVIIVIVCLEAGEILRTRLGWANRAERYLRVNRDNEIGFNSI